jgi:uncharacterized membrane protein
MTSSNPRAVRTTEFEQSTTIAAPADNVFDFMADVSNLPKYLPTVRSAQPQEGERVRTQGQAGGHSYDSDGHFRIDRLSKRIEWGSDGENDYGGWMEVDGDREQCKVTVHIHYAPPAEMAQKMAEQSPEGSFESAINEGIGKALESIKNICEGKGGKQEIEANQ